MNAILAIFHWNVFFHYIWPPSAFQDPLISSGFWVTVYMAVLAQLLGIVLGLITALAQMSRFRPARAIAGLYILYFRGTPVLVQLSLLYFGTAAIGLYTFPDIRLGNIVLQGIVQAGILGLGINEGAYMSEIIRAGIISIDSGQMEAARSIGMTFGSAMRWVVLPQAAKVIIPPLGNEFNNMLKSTTLVVTIGGVELFNAFEQINARVFQPFELFLAVSFYYLFLTLLWTIIQSRIESRLGERKGSEREQGTIGRLLFGGARVH
ncbi:MAG: amino acid ABC transporter permease [Chloroflexota bacterium]|nr:amino acid ABC transporter permease [Chloroflexota bacterium]